MTSIGGKTPAKWQSCALDSLQLRAARKALRQPTND
jgi:hypothetical protein